MNERIDAKRKNRIAAMVKASSEYAVAAQLQIARPTLARVIAGQEIRSGTASQIRERLAALDEKAA
jgi:hypothetical protein